MLQSNVFDWTELVSTPSPSSTDGSRHASYTGKCKIRHGEFVVRDYHGNESRFDLPIQLVDRATEIWTSKNCDASQTSVVYSQLLSHTQRNYAHDESFSDAMTLPRVVQVGLFRARIALNATDLNRWNFREVTTNAAFLATFTTMTMILVVFRDFAIIQSYYVAYFLLALPVAWFILPPIPKKELETWAAVGLVYLVMAVHTWTTALRYYLKEDRCVDDLLSTLPGTLRMWGMVAHAVVSPLTGNNGQGCCPKFFIGRCSPFHCDTYSLPESCYDYYVPEYVSLLALLSLLTLMMRSQWTTLVHAQENVAVPRNLLDRLVELTTPSETPPSTLAGVDDHPCLDVMGSKYPLRTPAVEPRVGCHELKDEEIMDTPLKDGATVKIVADAKLGKSIPLLTAGVVSTAAPPVVPSTSQPAHLAAIVKRQLLDTPIAGSGDLESVRRFYSGPRQYGFFKPECGLNPVDHEPGGKCYAKWYAASKPQLREKVDLLDGTELSRDFGKVKGFVKVELMSKAGVEHKDVDSITTRWISSRPASVQQAFGPYARCISEAIKQAAEYDPVTYTAGMNAEELGKVFNECNHSHCLEGDFKRYDSTINQLLLELERDVYRSMGCPELVLKNMEADQDSHGFGGGVVYNVDGTRKSGDATTSVGNSVIQGVLWRYLINSHHYKATHYDECWKLMLRDYKIFVMGDDSAVFGPYWLSENFKTGFLNFGLQYEPKLHVGLSHWPSKYMATYCSHRLWPVYKISDTDTCDSIFGEEHFRANPPPWCVDARSSTSSTNTVKVVKTHILGPLPGRSASKFGYYAGQPERKEDAKFASKLLYGDALGRRWCLGVPLIGPMVGAVLNTHSGDYIRPWRTEYEINAPIVTIPCPETYEVAGMVYPLSRDDDENLYLESVRLHQNGQLYPKYVSHPRVVKVLAMCASVDGVLSGEFDREGCGRRQNARRAAARQLVPSNVQWDGPKKQRHLKVDLNNGVATKDTVTYGEYKTHDAGSEIHYGKWVAKNACGYLAASAALAAHGVNLRAKDLHATQMAISTRGLAVVRSGVDSQGRPVGLSSNDLGVLLAHYRVSLLAILEEQKLAAYYKASKSIGTVALVNSHVNGQYHWLWADYSGTEVESVIANAKIATNAEKYRMDWTAWEDDAADYYGDEDLVHENVGSKADHKSKEEASSSYAHAESRRARDKHKHQHKRK